jgi:hypothetical protein
VSVTAVSPVFLILSVLMENCDSSELGRQILLGLPPKASAVVDLPAQQPRDVLD